MGALRTKQYKLNRFLFPAGFNKSLGFQVPGLGVCKGSDVLLGCGVQPDNLASLKVQAAQYLIAAQYPAKKMDGWNGSENGTS